MTIIINILCFDLHYLLMYLICFSETSLTRSLSSLYQNLTGATCTYTRLHSVHSDIIIIIII